MQQELKDLLPALRRFAYSLTGSMADADDLLQN
ncbi:MAG: RNA polymerase sigma factor, partial [Roseibium sp.]|nr:RNA polymerase sigma factor [Roseibium sp.]